MTKSICQKLGSNPRPHSWTRTLAMKVEYLESGALDHSAILTSYRFAKGLSFKAVFVA